MYTNKYNDDRRRNVKQQSPATYGGGRGSYEVYQSGQFGYSQQTPSANMSMSGGFNQLPRRGSPRSYDHTIMPQPHLYTMVKLKTDEKAYFDRVFDFIDKNRSGYLSGKTVFDAFLTSKLPKSTLSQIWELSKTSKSGLSREDFYIAMRLITIAQKGYPITKQSVLNITDLQLPHLEIVGLHPPPQTQPSFTKSHISPSSLSPRRSHENPWKMSAEQKKGYLNWFNTADKKRQGFLSGTAAKEFFGRSGLPNSVLQAVWNLSDVDKDNRLTADEFCIAMHLIQRVRRDSVALPSTLPAVLIPRPQRSVTPMPMSTRRTPTNATAADGSGGGGLLRMGSSERRRSKTDLDIEPSRSVFESDIFDFLADISPKAVAVRSPSISSPTAIVVNNNPLDFNQPSPVGSATKNYQKPVDSILDLMSGTSGGGGGSISTPKPSIISRETSMDTEAILQNRQDEAGLAQKKLQETAQTLSDTNAEVQAISSEVNELNQCIETCTSEQACLADTLRQQRGELCDVVEQRAELEEKMSEVEKSNKEKKSLLEQVERELKSERELKVEVENTLKLKREEEQNLRSQLKTFELDCQSTKRDIQNAEHFISSINEQLKNLNDQLNHQKTLNENQQLILENRLLQKATLSQERNTVKERLHEEQTKFQDLKRRSAMLDEEIDEQTKVMKELATQASTMEDLTSSARKGVRVRQKSIEKINPFYEFTADGPEWPEDDFESSFPEAIRATTANSHSSATATTSAVLQRQNGDPTLPKLEKRDELPKLEKIDKTKRKNGPAKFQDQSPQDLLDRRRFSDSFENVALPEDFSSPPNPKSKSKAKLVKGDTSNSVGDVKRKNAKKKKGGDDNGSGGGGSPADLRSAGNSIEQKSSAVKSRSPVAKPLDIKRELAELENEEEADMFFDEFKHEISFDTPQDLGENSWDDFEMDNAFPEPSIDPTTANMTLPPPAIPTDSKPLSSPKISSAVPSSVAAAVKVYEETSTDNTSVSSSRKGSASGNVKSASRKGSTSGSEESAPQRGSAPGIEEEKLDERRETNPQLDSADALSSGENVDNVKKSVQKEESTNELNKSNGAEQNEETPFDTSWADDDDFGWS